MMFSQLSWNEGQDLWSWNEGQYRGGTRPKTIKQYRTQVSLSRQRTTMHPNTISYIEDAISVLQQQIPYKGGTVVHLNF